jgi:hypothetical protein
MRLPLCILAMALSAWAADIDTPQPTDAPDQAQAPAPAAAAAPAPPPDAPAKLHGFVFSAYADGYATINFNHPSDLSGGLGNGLYNFNDNNGTPRLNLMKVTLDKSDTQFGFHIDAGFGETMRQIHAGDVSAQNNKALRYIEQAYVIWKPHHTHGTEIDYGSFVTSAGAEVIESNANWNYSRSLLFAWAIPYYHAGLRINMPVTKSWTLGAQVVNAWNTDWGVHNMQNIGVTSAWTKTLYTWSVNYYEGPNNFGTTTGKKNLVDTTLLLTPAGKFNFYVNGDWGQNGNPSGIGASNWYGVAGAMHYQMGKKFSLSARAEVFDDRDGYSTGVMQTIKEGTATGEYKYNDHLLGRIEYRHDWSNVPFFDRGADLFIVPNQTTVTFAIMALLGPYK